MPTHLGGTTRSGTDDGAHGSSALPRARSVPVPRTRRGLIQGTSTTPAVLASPDADARVAGQLLETVRQERRPAASSRVGHSGRPQRPPRVCLSIAVCNRWAAGELMDDIRILKWTPLVLIVGVACLATIFSPTLTATVAVVILNALLVWRCAAGRRGEVRWNGMFIMAGLLLLLPPIAYMTAGAIQG